MKHKLYNPHKDYRASKFVRLGVADEHAYNMYLNVMQTLYLLGLWKTILAENRLHVAWHKLVQSMKWAHLKRKYEVEQSLALSNPGYQDIDGV